MQCIEDNKQHCLPFKKKKKKNYEELLSTIKSVWCCSKGTSCLHIASNICSIISKSLKANHVKTSGQPHPHPHPHTLTRVDHTCCCCSRRSASSFWSWPCSRFSSSQFCFRWLCSRTSWALSLLSVSISSFSCVCSPKTRLCSMLVRGKCMCEYGKRYTSHMYVTQSRQDKKIYDQCAFWEIKIALSCQFLQ